MSWRGDSTMIELTAAVALHYSVRPMRQTVWPDNKEMED